MANIVELIFSPLFGGHLGMLGFGGSPMEGASFTIHLSGPQDMDPY